MPLFHIPCEFRNKHWQDLKEFPDELSAKFYRNILNMVSKLLNLGISLVLCSSFAVVSCSSDSDDNDMGGGGSSSGTVSGTVPDNHDTGNNNNSEPDNIKPSTSNPGDNPGENPGDNPGSTPGDNPGNNPGDNTGDDSGENQPTWNLIFEDNFEGTDSIPNPEYWSLAKKGTDTWNRHMSESYGQAYQKNGYLYLFGMESNGDYLTGGIESINKFDFKYGQVKCRARFLRQPQGNHTGIWMMPTPPTEQWPRSGEIDIMEHLDNQSLIYETVHFWNSDTEADAKADTSVSVDNDDFNIYGIIWDEKSVSFTVNGEVKLTYKNDNAGSDAFSYQYPFTKEFYLILSQSLGGKGTWEGVIDNKELPAIFQIDWIKVWQKSE